MTALACINSNGQSAEDMATGKKRRDKRMESSWLDRAQGLWGQCLHMIPYQRDESGEPSDEVKFCNIMHPTKMRSAMMVQQLNCPNQAKENETI